MKTLRFPLLIISSAFAVSSPAMAVTLVSYYDFEETSGTDAFDSARGLTETVIGTPIRSTDVSAPGSTRSLGLDGANERIESSYQGLGGSVSRSISAWIKTTAIGGGIVSWGDSSTNGAKWHFRLNNGSANGTVGALRTEIQGSYEIDGLNLADDEWHHIVSVYDGGSFGSNGIVKHYVDGIEVVNTGQFGGPQAVDTQLTGSYANQAFTPVIIGGRQQGTNSENYAGLLDDVAIYEGALSAAEVTRIYSFGGTIPEPSALLLTAFGAGLLLRRQR